jgi:hypothetical protein
VTLPSVDRIDIRAAALEDLLLGLNTEDRRKIANALAEAESDAAKPQPDKNEIGGALEAVGVAITPAHHVSKRVVYETT